MLITRELQLAIKRIRKKVPNDGDSPEVYLNARDKFRITTFYTIVDKLEAEMKIRGEIYREISERFSFLSDAPHNVTLSSTNTERYSQCCRKRIDAYPQDSTVISQLSFSSFILMCAISSVQKKKKKKDSVMLNFIK